MLIKIKDAFGEELIIESSHISVYKQLNEMCLLTFINGETITIPLTVDRFLNLISAQVRNIC